MYILFEIIQSVIITQDSHKVKNFFNSILAFISINLLGHILRRKIMFVRSARKDLQMQVIWGNINSFMIQLKDSGVKNVIEISLRKSI